MENTLIKPGICYDERRSSPGMLAGDDKAAAQDGGDCPRRSNVVDGPDVPYLIANSFRAFARR
ncbi:hypothetical protein [Phytohabitans kaempferiae]|uniref:Uncharacterized protein n=1 Tax=Phytohabitans kaempferiae TaxID=1620943 RepID=A0ABV6MD50_9ACTN